MILVRTVLQAQFGKAGELAALFSESNKQLAQATGWTGRWRVLTDLAGPFDTVVLEVETESLAAWERQRAELFQQPAFQATFPKTQALVASGRSEFYTIEAQG